MNASETYYRYWEKAATQLMNPCQQIILEALAHLEVPVSATVMERICDGQFSREKWYYHLTRLESLGLVELVGTKARRGALEKFFYLTSDQAE